MKIQHSIIIERSPDEVFAFFDDRSNDPRWLSSVIESQWLDPGETTRVGRQGRAVMDVLGRREFHDEVTRYEPGRLVEHRHVSGPVVMDTACIRATRLRHARHGHLCAQEVPRWDPRLACGTVRRQDRAPHVPRRPRPPQGASGGGAYARWAARGRTAGLFREAKRA